jgi:hypothetical protein
MTNRQSQKRRLEGAGFVHVSAWLPAAYAAKVAQQAEFYSEDVQRVLDEPPKPRGRPKKPEKAEEEARRIRNERV